jgi:DNA-binding transcriptional ArsR family regulator
MKIRPNSDQDHPALARLLRTLPPGRRRVARALLADSGSRTYAVVAVQLGIHLGTVHQHLRRLRLRHPHVYAALMAERARQLARRHERAALRAAAHSEAWHRKQAKRRFC